MKSSKQPIKVAEQFYAAIGSGKVEEILLHLCKDVSWRLVGPRSIPYFGTYRGVNEVREFFQKLSKSEHILEFEPTRFIVSENDIVVLGKETCESIATGASFSTEWVHILEFRDSKIASWTEFIDSSAVERAHATDDFVNTGW